MKKIMITLCVCVINIPLIAVRFSLPEYTKKEIQNKENILQELVESIPLSYRISYMKTEFEKAHKKTADALDVYFKFYTKFKSRIQKIKIPFATSEVEKKFFAKQKDFKKYKKEMKKKAENAAYTDAILDYTLQKMDEARKEFKRLYEEEMKLIIKLREMEGVYSEYKDKNKNKSEKLGK